MTAATEPSSAAAGPVWDDRDWAPLPELAGAVSADVCVVGLGGSGLSAVITLLDHGVRVVGVDAGPVAGGAAGRNGGFLLAGMAKFHHEVVDRLGRDRAVALYRLTLDQMDRMTAQTPAAIRRVGLLRIAASEEEERDCDAHRASLEADGFPVEPYEGPEGRGILIPTDGSFNPLLRCRSLARQALAGDALLYERSPVVEIGPGLVGTEHGRVACGNVLVAVDGRLEQLLPEVADRVRTVRLQMLATAPDDRVRFDRPVYYRWGLEYWQQLPDRRVALGGFRDVGGDDEKTTSREPSETVQRRLEIFLRDHLGVRAPVTNRWAASVGFTADGVPVVGEVRPGLWAIGGYSGTGNVVGALLGRLVSDRLVTGSAPGLELFDV